MSRDSLPPLEDEFSRALLGSADADAPTPAAYAKAAAALGVGVSIGASLPAAAAVGAAGAAGIARWSSLLSAKLFFGISGALLVGGAGALLLRGPESSKPAPPHASALHAPAAALAVGEALPVAPAQAARAIAPLLGPGAATPTAAKAIAQGQGPTRATAQSQGSTKPVAPAQAAGSLAARPATVMPAARRLSQAAPARPSADSSLSEQVQSLDRARVALASGDSSSALAEIARYRTSWPNGVFLTEASVLEIEALAARGERSLAQARAAEFVAAHPGSPQADRLRALLPGNQR